MRIRINKNYDKGKMDEIVGYFTGLGVGPTLSTFLHELGHGLAVKLAGKEPHFSLWDKSSGSMSVSYISDNVPQAMQTFITAAGPIANGVVAAVFLGLSEKTKNKKLKYGLKGFSFIDMLLTSMYAISDYLGQTHGDFSQLAADGIGYEYTIPLTLLGTAAVSAYIYRSEKKKAPSKRIRKKSFFGSRESRNKIPEYVTKDVDEFEL